jgi:CRP/FNR family cyclic AMP-dependent transcriptional regulator
VAISDAHQVEREAFLRELGTGGARRRFRAGETLFLEGDIADRMLLIRHGAVKVSCSHDGREAMLALCGAGELLGELSTLDGAPRSATAVALGEVEATVIPARELTRVLSASPEAGIALLRIVAERLRDADRRSLEFASLDTLGRVATRVVELCERFGDAHADGIRIELALSQDDLAAWCGSSRQATVKALKTLRELGLLATARRALLVHDLDGVRRHASVTAR